MNTVYHVSNPQVQRLLYNLWFTTKNADTYLYAENLAIFGHQGDCQW